MGVSLWESALAQFKRFNYPRLTTNFIAVPRGFLQKGGKKVKQPKRNNPILSGDSTGQRFRNYCFFKFLRIENVGIFVAFKLTFCA